MIEVTRNKLRGEWHPHIHIVVDGNYIPQRALLGEWQKVCQGAKVVDIRKVHSARKAAEYMASYVAKSSDAGSIAEDALWEWARSVQSMRMLQTFGNARGRKLELEAAKRPDDWARIADGNALARAAVQGMTEADALLDQIRSVDRGPKPIESPPLTDAQRALNRHLRSQVDAVLARWLLRQRARGRSSSTPHLLPACNSPPGA